MPRIYGSIYYSDYEWDEGKSQRTLGQRGFDFTFALRIFEGPVTLCRSDRYGEVRWLAVGAIGDILLAVVFTFRGDYLRIISARRARRNEQAAYRAVFPG